MTVKNHKRNTNFQIAHFLAGSCHTPDGAFAMLCELKEERQGAIQNFIVSKIRTSAKRIRAERLLVNRDQTNVLEGQADLLEIANQEEIGRILYEAAVDELHFIDRCIEAINPFRQFKNLPDLEAHEATQYQEWKFELIERAENSILCTGSVSVDHFATMRMHPAFQSEILPRINDMMLMIRTPEGFAQLQSQIGGSKFKSISQLVE